MYDEVLNAQGGTCAMPGCDAADDGTDRSRRLHVDHDHACCPGNYSCGACIRGLLCHRHNTGVGMFLDDPTELLRAADYVASRRSPLGYIARSA
jgi:hypothetical protein